MGKDPARLGSVLGRMAVGWGIENPVETARIFSSWAEIVGPEVAARCQPSSLKQGVLKVCTESTVWASEFRYLAPEVTARINAALGTQVIREIKPWVKAGVGENRRMPPRPAPPPATTKASAQMAREAAEVARGVDDPALSEALTRAFLAAKISQGARPSVVYSEGSPGAGRAPSRSRSKPAGRQP